jgi:hypothetical protein
MVVDFSNIGKLNYNLQCKYGDFSHRISMSKLW